MDWFSQSREGRLKDMVWSDFSRPARDLARNEFHPSTAVLGYCQTSLAGLVSLAESYFNKLFSIPPIQNRFRTNRYSLCLA